MEHTEHNTSQTILVIDDEEVIRAMIGEMLRRQGYEVVFAANGIEAIDIFESEHSNIDLVILDMIMPYQNGKETFVGLKEIDPRVKVLLTSGYSVDGMTQEIMQMGAKGFIKKPFSPRPAILNRIKEILEADA